MDSIRIGYSYFESIKTIDPANINTIYQANLIENLYSRLVDIDNNGQLTCSLCNKFWIEDKKIYFQIRSDIKTLSGHNIDSQDVLLSFSRLLKLNSNTHGNLYHFIENESDISIKDDLFIINVKKSHYTQFIIPLLTSMDFSIIPRNALNKNNEIISFSETTGAYYLKSDSKDGHLVLEANRYAPQYNKNILKTIFIIPTSNQEAIEKFQKNLIDMIDVTVYPRTQFYESFITKNLNDLSLFKTLPMNLLYLGISQEAQKKFKPEVLFRACKTISKIYLNFKTYGYGFTETVEFFQQGGNGHLSEIEINDLKKTREFESVKGIEQKVTLGIYKSSYLKVKEAFKDHPEILIKSFDEDPAFIAAEKQPDIFIQTTDSTFVEDLSMISYNITSGSFGLSKDEGVKWVEDYISTVDKVERISKLKILQMNFLKKPSLYPIGVSPYWAIAKKNIELNFPTIFPGSHWWKIRIN